MKESALQVLLVEDNAGDARLLREMFSKEKAGSFELTDLLRMSEAVVHLAKGGGGPAEPKKPAYLSEPARRKFLL
jgi:hypothetical protein